MKQFLVIALLMVQVAFAQPTITSPTPGQEYYEGEKVEIGWKSTRPDAWKVVNLATESQLSHRWIQVGAPNNGSYDWSAASHNGDGNITIAVQDGPSNTDHTSRVTIKIHSGPRPPTVTSIKPQLKPTVIIGIVTIPMNTYRFERQIGTNDWEHAFDQQIDTAEFYWAGAYATNKCAFRVTNLTTMEEVEFEKYAGVSVEWDCIPNHKYRIAGSTDFSTWETIAEGEVDTDYVDYQVFAEGPMNFYTIIDLTQN